MTRRISFGDYLPLIRTERPEEPDEAAEYSAADDRDGTPCRSVHDAHDLIGAGRQSSGLNVAVSVVVSRKSRLSPPGPGVFWM